MAQLSTASSNTDGIQNDSGLSVVLVTVRQVPKKAN